MSYEFYDETWEDGEGGYDSRSIWIRYWIDQEWPNFCVSYFLYDEDDHRLDEGAYKIVKRFGKGKCVPIK